MSRRQKHGNRDRWLVSYADFITLMFAFFVVMYASAEYNRDKAEHVSSSIQGAFQQLGLAPDGYRSTVAHTLPPSAAKRIPGKISKPPSSTHALPDLENSLNTSLASEIRDKKISLRKFPEGIIISLKDVGVFRSGEADLLPPAKQILSRIAKLLHNDQFAVRVEGHTDNIPIHNEKFDSNWALSTARATAVVAILIEENGFDPARVAAAGYSQYHPVASNDTAEGRSANRRIDLVVFEPQP